MTKRLRSRTVGALVAGLGAIAALAPVGCTLTSQGVRDKASPANAQTPRVGGNGEVIAPRSCALKLLIAKKPHDDPALVEAVWQAADEQALDPAARSALHANGLRVGVITGELPAAIRDVLSAPPPHRIEAQTVILPEGETALFDPETPPAESLSLMIGLKDKVVGKVFESAKGFVRVGAGPAPAIVGDDAVNVRITPEIHHGPLQKDWAIASGNTAMTPGQIIQKNGQKEELFRDLAASVALRPGQVLVVGGKPEKRGSLGEFLFGGTEEEGRSDRVLFLWATRAETGTPPGLTPIDP